MSSDGAATLTALRSKHVWPECENSTEFDISEQGNHTASSTPGIVRLLEALATKCHAHVQFVLLVQSYSERDWQYLIRER